MDSVRLVQITDLHILADDNASLSGVNPHQSLSRVIDDIKSLSPAPGLVIASGDLADDGSTEAYRRLRRLLLELPCAVYVMAGNHDETEVMHEELPGENIVFQRRVDCENWKLLLVDSKLPGSSFGFISDEEFDWLDQQLSEEDGRPVLLAMHHTPLRLCASPSCQVKNADAFLSKIKNFNRVKGLIAGHTHNQVDQTHGDLRIMTTPSTMVQVTHNQIEAIKSNEEFWHFHEADTSRHGYRIVDLNADGSFESEVRWVPGI
ncbi:MAG: metallophosphoesterase [Gammaproteobacteria bacterium]|nr:metallophosphoesterase [Gammaproteobacteria bacterium]